MQADAELLRRYAADRSEAAFTELIRRHVDLVYSAARRLVNGDVHRAQDVTQQVFSELARRAQRLTTHPALAGWLYTTTRLMARRAIRTEQRRMAREQEAHTMNELLRDSAPEESWDHLRPVLDDAMHKLGEKDRLAVLLRFFQNKSLREVGIVLELNENAARMRVERALDKLRAQLARQGVTSTTGALALSLAGNAVSATPSAFVGTLASGALAGAAAGTGTTLTLLELLTMAKLKTGIISAIVVASIATPFVLRHQTQVQLRAENEALRQQVDQLSNQVAQANSSSPATRRTLVPRLPAPRMQVAAQIAAPPDEVPPTNVIARLLKGGDAPKLTGEQIESYLKENQRNAASLLAAYRTTGNETLLQEAMQKFPGDPQVAFEAAFTKEVSPDERRRWLNALQQSAPQNALADYLSAAHHFKAGQPDQAVQDVIAASGKSQFQDYTLERVQDDEEAYRAAGYSVAEAKTIPSMQLLLPQLAQMKELSQNLTELAKSYRQAGDEPSAQATLQMAANLGQRYSHASPGEAEISQLVGIAIERIALKEMDLNSPYGTGGTVKDRLDQLLQQNTGLWQLAKQTEALMPQMTDQDWISYKDRWRNFGEEAAGRWLINKYGQK